MGGVNHQLIFAYWPTVLLSDENICFYWRLQLDEVHPIACRLDACFPNGRWWWYLIFWLKLHQHRRLTRAQSHHGSAEEKKRRKILARKVGPQTAVKKTSVYNYWHNQSYWAEWGPVCQTCFCFKELLT